MTSDARSYRRLLRLFPRAFRDEYGEEMVRLYVDRCAEVRGRRGAELHLRAEATIDALVHAAGEWGRVALAGGGTILREGTSMDGWIQDLRYGARSLLRRPGFAAAAVATLALGIGAVVAIFSVVNGVLLEPLPYPEPDRLVVPWQVDPATGERSRGIDHPDVRYWQEEVPGLRVAGYSTSRPTLTEMGEPEVVSGARVSDGLLGVFGLEPEVGRDVTAAEDVVGGPNVVLVSHAFWQNRLSGDPAAIGRTLTLSGQRWEIVGVAPDGFDFPDGTDLWMPRHHDPAGCGHGCRIMNGIGRIERGATLEQVATRMDAASAQLAQAFPDSHRDVVTRFEPLLDTQVADVRTALWVLMGSVTMVLLIACANVANLLLVRASERVGEVALRATLGAPRVRIVRQLLTESLLLSVVGGAIGIGLAAWGVSLMVAAAPAGIPRLDAIGVDARVLGFALLVVLAVTAFFGLAPALRLARVPLNQAMGNDRRAAGGRGSGLSRSFLLSAEVALSLMLLLGAGLMFGSLRSIAAQDLGFSTERVERFRLSLPETRYDVYATIRFFDELEARMTALPEVEQAGTAFGVPLGSGRFHTSTELLDRPPVAPADLPDVAVRPASPGYREAIGIQLLRGRWFEDSDREDTEGVAVINQAAADRFYPDVDPLGRRIKMSISVGFGDDPERTIVGVVGNARSYSATEPDDATAYVPNAQFGMDVMYVTMRLERGARTALPAARAVLKEMDPALAITNVERIEDAVARQAAPTRFYLTLIGSFSMLALILAAIGLYGVVAYSVSRRTREIGIRVALGARGGEVVRMAVLDGVLPAALGVAGGLVGALLGAHALDSLLYGIEPQDPVTIVAVTSILVAVVLVATLLPARRASRIPPASALRIE
jgi:putative ABC transport system permease protein